MRYVHGHTADKSSPTYNSWAAMRQRTRTLYRGRKITVCARWRSFVAFLADMGERPAGTTLDRIDNSGNYEPANCRWATTKQQSRNTRLNRRVLIDGETRPLVEWQEHFGIKKSTYKRRVRRGMNPIAALTTPLLRKRRNAS